MTIDSAAIMQAVGSLNLTGNEEGLIPAFGLYLTRHFADYYNKISFAYLHGQEALGGDAATNARTRLVDAGQVCGFHTFGGIMLSQEWDAVVLPMIESREDWVLGITAVINCLGWGRWSVEELVPRERMRMRVLDGYESVGYMRDFPQRRDGVCFLAAGGASAIMNLLYHGDITGRPALTQAYYRRLFGTEGRYVAHEVSCRCAGSGACEFVVERAR